MAAFKRRHGEYRMGGSMGQRSTFVRLFCLVSFMGGGPGQRMQTDHSEASLRDSGSNCGLYVDGRKLLLIAVDSVIGIHSDTNCVNLTVDL